ncbi:MAG: class I SAM-dependent methyltransferase [Proteobacteria bacterium]|nr:class I SAM-dependent methyltransferase [Pseudomonadota bacterium]
MAKPPAIQDFQSGKSSTGAAVQPIDVPVPVHSASSGLDVSAFANRLRKNLAHWQKWARRRGITCYRIYDRDVPQFPFAIDWYETVAPRSEVHLHVQEIDTGWKRSDAEYTAWLIAVCDAICAACALPAAQLHLKRRERQRGTSQYEKLDAAAEPSVVEEGGHRFEVNFDTYLDTGLFLDHRPARGMVAETIAARAGAGAGTRFLNLFAYTGSFTVYAACAGSGSSVTVDLSNTYQAWTARNFTLNGIDPGRHALVRADVLAWLQEAAGGAQRFDVIVLDPPSFSNSKKMQGVLDVQRDHVLLVRQCHALLAAGGELFFSTNLRSFAIDPQLAHELGLRGITHRSVPEDYRRPSRPPPHQAWHAIK